jgi:hypothetical protein
MSPHIKRTLLFALSATGVALLVAACAPQAAPGGGETAPGGGAPTVQAVATLAAPTIQAVATQAAPTLQAAQTSVPGTVQAAQTTAPGTIQAAQTTVPGTAQAARTEVSGTVQPMQTAVSATATALAPTAQAVATHVAPTVQAASTQVVNNVATSVAASPVQITTVQVDPNDTRVMIRNSSANTVNLRNWTLLMGQTGVVLGDVKVEPNQALTLHLTSGTDTNSDAYVGYGSAIVSATYKPGEPVVLVSSSSDVASIYKPV